MCNKGFIFMYNERQKILILMPNISPIFLVLEWLYFFVDSNIKALFPSLPLWKGYQYFVCLSFTVTWGGTGQTIVLCPESYNKTETPPKNSSQLKNEALGINQAKNIHPLISRIPNDTGHWKTFPLTLRENSALPKMNLMPNISVKAQ
jgi:hypothetical protein